LTADTSREDPPMRKVKATDETIDVYPNPFNNRINVKISIKKAETVTLRLFDIFGKTISVMQSVLAEGLNNIELQTGDIPNGMYILEIDTDKEVYKRKLLKN